MDYGHGLTNIDHKTGIRYGAVPVYLIDGDYLEDLEPIYISACDNCGHETEEEICPKCGHEIDYDLVEPIGFKIDTNGILAFQSYDSTDIIIEKSPYYTLCSFASPCFPGGGYIPDQNPHGIKAYCLPPEYFYDSKIKVYNIKTNRRIK